MSLGIFTRINSGCKIFLSVQQWTRSTVVRNEKYLVCRDYNAFTKSPEFFPLLKDSQTFIKKHSVCSDLWRSNIFIKHQYLISLECKAFSDKCAPPNSLENKKEEKKKQSITQRLKQMFKDYWYIIAPVHLVTSIFWFGTYYYLAVSGINIIPLLEYIGAPDSFIQTMSETNTGNFVIAYGLYKFTTPVRFTVTAGGSKFFINYFKKTGWINTPAKVEVHKDSNKDKKGILDKLVAECKDKMQVTKNEFLKTKNEMQKQLNKATEELNKSVSESRQDFKQCVESGAEEWRMINRMLKKSLLKVKENIDGKKKNK